MDVPHQRVGGHAAEVVDVGADEGLRARQRERHQTREMRTATTMRMLQRRVVGVGAGVAGVADEGGRRRRRRRQDGGNDLEAQKQERKVVAALSITTQAVRPSRHRPLQSL